MLTTTATMFERDKKRAPSYMIEYPIGRSGTLRTTREGNSPAESGTAVPLLGISSDTEPGSPARNNQAANSPERGRSG